MILLAMALSTTSSVAASADQWSAQHERQIIVVKNDLRAIVKAEDGLTRSVSAATCSKLGRDVQSLIRSAPAPWSAAFADLATGARDCGIDYRSHAKQFRKTTTSHLSTGVQLFVVALTGPSSAATTTPISPG